MRFGVRQSPSGPVAVPPGTATGQVLTWDDESERANWGSSGFGSLQKFDLSGSPDVLYHFNDSLDDLSGNGIDLEVETGTAYFAEVSPLQKSLYFQSTRLIHPVFEPLIAYTGDCTIAAILQLDANPDAGEPWVSHNAAGETPPTNILYSAEWSGGAVPKIPRWLSEHGNGTNDAYTPSTDQSFGPIHNLIHVVIRRQANIIQCFGNGAVFGPPSAALTAPDGGTDGRFRLGGDTSTTANSFALLCYAMYGYGVTDLFVKNQYNFTLGPVYGLRAL